MKTWMRALRRHLPLADSVHVGHPINPAHPATRDRTFAHLPDISPLVIGLGFTVRVSVWGLGYLGQGEGEDIRGGGQMSYIHTAPPHTFTPCTNRPVTRLSSVGGL